MTMQFIKIGTKFISLAHIRAVATSPSGQAVHVYLGALTKDDTMPQRR